MPLSNFGTSSENISSSTPDKSLFVQKRYLRFKNIESNIEEGINMKNQSKNKNLPNPVDSSESSAKIYVDNIFNDPSVKRLNMLLSTTKFLIMFISLSERVYQTSKSI